MPQSLLGHLFEEYLLLPAIEHTEVILGGVASALLVFSFQAVGLHDSWAVWAPPLVGALMQGGVLCLGLFFLLCTREAAPPAGVSCGGGGGGEGGGRGGMRAPFLGAGEGASEHEQQPSINGDATSNLSTRTDDYAIAD